MNILSILSKLVIASFPVYALTKMYPLLVGERPSIPVDDVPIVLAACMAACVYMAAHFIFSSIVEIIALFLGFRDDRSERQK